MDEPLCGVLAQDMLTPKTDMGRPVHPFRNLRIVTAVVRDIAVAPHSQTQPDGEFALSTTGHRPRKRYVHIVHSNKTCYRDQKLDFQRHCPVPRYKQSNVAVVGFKICRQFCQASYSRECL